MRTSMSSFHGKSVSGCERAPLTVKACLFAGGAESSALGRFRSSILTASSDGAATVLVSSLIGEATVMHESPLSTRALLKSSKGRQMSKCTGADGREDGRERVLGWSCEGVAEEGDDKSS
jgi:hypothetical protein